MMFHNLFQNWQDMVEFDAQTVIFSAGEPAEILYFIISGEIELHLHGRSLSIQSTGGIIGAMAMLPSATHSTTATSRSSVKLARIDQAQLKELVAGNAEFSLYMMAALANRLRDADKLIAGQFEPKE